MNRTLSLSASLLALLIPPGTQAQSAPASTEAPTPVAQEVRPLQPAPTALEGQTVISGDELRRVPSESLVQALRGRLPLASFGPDSGSAGSALQLWGLPSLLTGVSPLYVVDGVLLGPEFSNLDTSPLHQLNTYDVERLELLTGAVATGRYGQRGAGGVFVITTRRAQPGPLQVRLSQRVGLSQLSRKLGSRTFTTQEEAIAVFGERARDYYQPGRVFDHEQQLAGRLGPSVETLLELGGGSERTRYFLSGLFKHDTGIVANTGYGKQGLKLGLDQEVSRSVRFSATAHLLHSVMRRAYSPYQLLTSTPNFLDLSARKDGTYPAHPFLATGANPLELTTSYNDEEDGWRVMGSARLDATLWSAGAHTLELMVQGGLNGTQQSGHTHHVLASERPSWRSDSSGMTRALNGQLELRYQLRPESGGLALQTAAGLLLDARWLDGKSSLVPPGSPPSGPNDGATRYIGAGAGGAAFLRASGQLFQERLLVDAALRAEKWSAFGSLSPMASLGYRLLVPRGPLDELRPRLTYSVLEDKRYANLPPERRRELELGVDVLALEGKARLGVRAWQQHLTDFHVLLQQTSTTTGSPLHQEAGGELLGRGVEAALEVVPIQGERLQWTSRTLFGLSRTRVEQLPAPFILGGFGAFLGTYRLKEGASMTQLVGNDGLKPDGTCCTVRAVGDTAPDFRMSFQNEVRLGGLSFWVLLDWQRGGEAINLLRFLQDTSSNSPDYETSGRERQQRFATTTRAYLEDTTFLKVREVALGYALPENWYRGVLPGVRQVRLSASARDVLTLTGYSGLDPEVGGSENAPLLRNLELFPRPPSRSAWLSLDVGF